MDRLAVQLHQTKQGDYIYKPVTNWGFGSLFRITGYGWFPASQWNWVQSQLARYDLRLTKRWLHIQRQRAAEQQERH